MKKATRYMKVNVHSEGEILTAVLKNGGLEAAKKKGFQLWAIAANPYVMNVINDQGEKLFFKKV